jgi:hypothetical protein
MRNPWIAGCVLAALVNACSHYTFHVEGEEAKRAAAALLQKESVVAEATREDRRVHVLLKWDDDLTVTCWKGAELETSEDARLALVVSDPALVEKITYEETNWGPFLLTMGIVSAILSYLFSTGLALGYKNPYYAIPAYGPARWTVDFISAPCDGLECLARVVGIIFLGPVGISVAASHVVGPVMIVSGATDTPDREMKLEPSAPGSGAGIAFTFRF